MRRSTVISIAVTTLGLAVVWHVLSGQAAAPQSQRIPTATASKGLGAIDAVACLPDDLDMIVVVDRAADLRKSPVGTGALKFLDEAGTLTEVTKAWTALAAQLGWSEAEAFDRLLGTRVILASRTAGEADRRWAMLSDVSADTDRRLRERLKVSPRGISQGHQILSVENGEFELVTHRLLQAKPATQRTAATADNDRFTLVFGPTGRGELLDELLGTLTTGGSGSPMRQQDAFELAKGQGVADVLVMTSTAPRGAARDLWRDFVIMTASSTNEPGAAGAGGSSWRAGVLVRDRAQQDQLRAMAATDSGSFEALRGGSLLAVIQNAPLPPSLGFGLSGASVLSALPIPPDARALLTSRQAVAVRSIGRDDRMSVSVAVQSTNSGGLARAMDAAISRGVDVFEQRMSQDSQKTRLPATAVDYAGIAPEAVRVLPLPATGASPMSMLTSRPLVLSWVYATRPGMNGPYNTQQRACEAEQLAAPVLMAPKLHDGRAGWMVINASQEPSPSTGCDPVAEARRSQANAAPDTPPDAGQILPKCAPTAAEIVRNDANALTTLAAGETERWFLLAHIRPAALEQRLPSLFPDFKGARSIMRRFNELDIQIKATDVGDLSGEVRLRFASDQP
ncbi:MAG: hypothetical protein K2W85_09430 [Phycisphaerales bacterium]|nr:hypothetical protein [Phycisphaerales bacterium]